MQPDSKIWSVLGWIGIALLAAAAAYLAFAGRWQGAGTMAAFAAASAVLVAMRKQLPSMFSFLFVVAALANAAGYVWNLFQNKAILWYDEVVHGFTMAAIGLAIAFWIHHARAGDQTRPAFGFVATVTLAALVIGAGWEVVEWLGNFIGSTWDTTMDLVMDTLGGLLAGLFAVWIIRTHPPEQLRGGEA